MTGRRRQTRAPRCPPHHFVIEPPDGPVSVGVCKRCGERREFRNSPPGKSAWESEPARPPEAKGP